MKLSFGKKKETAKEIFLRLDDRLIHGQVIQGWVPFLKVEEIYVVDDKIADDQLQQKILSLSVPPSINVRFVKPDSASQIIKKSKAQKILVLFNKISNLIRIARELNIQKINLGNYHSPGDSVRLSNFFSCSAEELTELKKLKSEGREIEIKNLPGDKGRELNS